jgi:hypothetical protein
MIYDTLLDLFKLIFGTIEFFKPFAVPLGILVLLLKQNNIKKVINGRLPKRFRDTQSSDIYDMMRDIKAIKEHLGVVESSNTQQNGSEIIRTRTLTMLYTLLHKVTILRRLTKMNKWTSRKFLMAILAAILPIINSEFNLGLDTNVVIAAIGGIVAFILGEAHVDAKRAGGSSDAIAPIDTSSNK